MSLSRGVHLMRCANRSLKSCGNQIRQSHGSGYSYRCGAYPPSNFQKYGSEILSGLMWYWVLYHIATEPEHLLGEFPWPDASKWSNEELGVPSDELD